MTKYYNKYIQSFKKKLPIFIHKFNGATNEKLHRHVRTKIKR